MRIHFKALVVSFLSLFSIGLGLPGSELIREWAVWGPGWGRGGLEANGVNYEAHLRPQPGDVNFSLGTDRTYAMPWAKRSVADGVVDFLSENPCVDKYYLNNGATLWAGAAAYTHVYIYSESDQSILFDLSGSSTPAFVRLNGALLPSKDRGHYYGSLNTGWNRLLVKLLSPSLLLGSHPVLPSEAAPSNWRCRVRYASANGSKLTGVHLQTNDPDRGLSVGQDLPLLRYRTMITGTDGEQLLFSSQDPVSLNFAVEVGTGVHENLPKFCTGKFRGGRQVWSYSRALSDADWDLDEALIPDESVEARLPRQARVTVRDYDDQVILNRVDNLEFNLAGDVFTANYSLGMESMPIGYYTIKVDLLDSSEKVLAYAYPHGLSVLWGPVETTKDETPRKMSAVGHWLVGSDLDRSIRKLKWMHHVGLTRHQKLSQAWSVWGVKHDKKGHVTIGDSPKIDKLLEVADTYGISVVGDLLMGYPISDKSNASEMALTGAEASAKRQESMNLKAVNQIVFVPKGTGPLPKVGSDAYRQTMYDYVYGIVSRYKDRIHVWSGDNEIDLHSGRGSEVEARAYVEASRIVYEAMKAADPDAQLVSGSLVRQSEFTEDLFKFGFADTIDILDVHAHPSDAPSLSDEVIGNSNKEGLGVIGSGAEALDLPVWYGEFSAPLAHSYNGVKGQAEAIAKQVAWGLIRSKLEGMSYLVPYSEGANLGFCSIVGAPLPATNAINVVNHLLDGRRQLEPLSELPDFIEQLRVSGIDGLDTLLVWSEVSQVVEIPVSSQKVELVDLIGRTTTLVPVNGAVQLRVGVSPQYIRACF